MAGFTVEFTTTAPNETVTLPATNNGTYNATVFWGDTSQSTITTWDDADLTHTYSAAGTYEVEIIGSFPGWSFQNGGDCAKCTDIITWGDSVDFDGFLYLRYGFWGCSCATAGDGPILFDTGANGQLEYLFRNNTEMTSAPPDLWSNATSFATRVNFAFDGCTSLAGSPPTLAGMSLLERCDNYCSSAPLTGGTFPKMTGCTSITNAYRMFYFSTGLASIDALCYEDLTSCTNFGQIHYNCRALAAPINAFCSSDDYATRFSSLTVDFSNAFYRTTPTATGGHIPDVWKCAFTGVTTTNFVNNSAETETTALNWNGVPGSGQPVNWYGPTTIPDPTIASVSDDTVADGQNITITGNTFAYDCDFYLTDNPDWDSSATFVLQTLNSVTEIGGDIDIDFGSLTGTAYLHAEHYRDQDTGTGGYTMTLESAGVPIFTGTDTLATLASSGALHSVSVFTGADDLAALAANGTLYPVPDMTGADTLAAIQAAGVLDVTLLPTFIGADTLAALTSSGDLYPIHVLSGTDTLAALASSGALHSVSVFTGADDLAALAANGTLYPVPDMTGADTLAAIQAAGVLDVTLLPTFIGADTLAALTSSGDLYPIHVLSGADTLAALASSGALHSVSVFTGADDLAALIAAGIFSIPGEAANIKGMIAYPVVINDNIGKVVIYDEPIKVVIP